MTETIDQTKMEFKELGKRLMNRLESKPAVSLTELIKLGQSRQSVLYHIKKLHKEKRIHAFITGDGLNDHELFYSIMPREYPKEIHEINKLIKDMCSEKTDVAVVAYENFINLCATKDIAQNTSIRIAYALISRVPDHKEKIVFNLMITTNDLRERINDAYMGKEGPTPRFERLLEDLI